MGNDPTFPGTGGRIEDLVARALAGERRSIGRLATLVENGGRAAERVLTLLYPKSGHAHVIGITGPPGAGKSTLTNALIGAYRASGDRVAVVAIDPSSERTGGATLGDRIRMTDRYADDGVWVRSMANRGQPGGVAAATGDMVALFDALGYDPILVESVGAGQGEIAIRGLVQTNLVVQAPGAGDHIQALKAGLLETADAHVVNKDDLPGAGRLARDLLSSLDLAWPPGSGETGHVAAVPAVIRVSAQTGSGIDDLMRFLRTRNVVVDNDAGMAVRRARARADITARVTAGYLAGLDGILAQIDDRLVDEVASRRIAPGEAARQVLATDQARLDNIDT